MLVSSVVVVVVVVGLVFVEERYVKSVFLMIACVCDDGDMCVLDCLDDGGVCVLDRREEKAVWVVERRRTVSCHEGVLGRKNLNWRCFSFYSSNVQMNSSTHNTKKLYQPDPFFLSILSIVRDLRRIALSFKQCTKKNGIFCRW